MSRVLFFVFALALLATTMASIGAHNSNEIVVSCGGNLVKRVIGMCGMDECSADPANLAVLACTAGVSDSQIQALCCPQ